MDDFDYYVFQITSLLLCIIQSTFLIEFFFFNFSYCVLQFCLVFFNIISNSLLKFSVSSSILPLSSVIIFMIITLHSLLNRLSLNKGVWDCCWLTMAKIKSLFSCMLSTGHRASARSLEGGPGSLCNCLHGLAGLGLVPTCWTVGPGYCTAACVLCGCSGLVPIPWREGLAPHMTVYVTQ